MKKLIVLCMILILATLAYAAPKYYVDTEGTVHATDIKIKSGAWSDIREYSNNVITACNANPTKEIWITSTSATISSASTIACDLKLMTGGSLVSTATLTLSGDVRGEGGTINNSANTDFTSGSLSVSGDYQIFAGSGTVSGLEEVTPELWGVSGTGDQTAIQKAIDAVDSTDVLAAGTVKFVKGKAYYISGQVLIGNAKLEGDGTRIYINASSSFTLNETAGNPHVTRPAIKNKGSRGNSYSSTFSSAHEVYIKGIEFIMNKQTASPLVAESLLLENVSRGMLEKVAHKATNDQVGSPHNSFDFYANVKNVVVRDSEFQTLSNPNDEMGAQRQGGFWVRNSGPDSVGAVTENIVFDNCRFRTNQWDEPLAIFTAESTIKNVRILNSTFSIEDITEHPIIIAAAGTGTAGKVYDVTIDGCKFVGSSTALIRQGIKLTTGKSINVHVLNSKFEIYSHKNSPTQGVTGFVIQNASRVDNVYIEILGDDASTTQLIQAVKGCDLVSNSTVSFASTLNATSAYKQAFVENDFIIASTEINGTTTITGNPGAYAGTYTPTLTNVSNLDSSGTFTAQYTRVGNTVTVSGRADVDPTAAAETKLGISLPIPSDFIDLNDCAGVAFSSSVAGQGAAILADMTNNRAEMRWIAVDTSGRGMFYTFTYVVK